MTERYIPFMEIFRDKMLSSKKTATSRTRKYGEVGDFFKIFGATFTITKVYRYRLDCVAYLLCHQEGTEDPEDFKKGWATIHPRRGYVPEQEVWVHEFKKVEV